MTMQLLKAYEITSKTLKNTKRSISKWYNRNLGAIFGWSMLGGIALTIAGGIYAINRLNSDIERHKYRDPSKIQVQSQDVGFQDISSGFSEDYFISDLNNDGEADVIHFSTRAEWIANGVKSRFYVDKSTKTMTLEIRAAATKEMQAERNLAILIAKENYRLQEEKNKPKYGGQQ